MDVSTSPTGNDRSNSSQIHAGGRGLFIATDARLNPPTPAGGGTKIAPDSIWELSVSQINIPPLPGWKLSVLGVGYKHPTPIGVV